MSTGKRRILALLPALAIQIVWLYVLMTWLEPYAALVDLGLSLLAVGLVFYIMTLQQETTYKTLWLLTILCMPILGAVLYLFFGGKKMTRPLQKKLEAGKAMMPDVVADRPETAVLPDVERLAQTFRLVEQKTGFRTEACREVQYYPAGEKMFAQMLKDLEEAQHYIYVEYFIVEHGVMWDSMLEIMERKISQGVDVRVMYDDLGSISTFSLDSLKKLQEKGIKCVRFNTSFFVHGTLNYRDHRKMLIIDGKVAYSGGVNLADEYINQKERFGYWKDIGFRITGKPVLNYVQMYAEFWNAFSPEDPVPVTDYMLNRHHEAGDVQNGLILSYYDSPIRDTAVSNTLYVELLSQATHYAWFYTPYLLLGDELLEAFTRAARRGVDVRIIMPGIPDKPLIYRMSRSFYQPLLEGGVKVYEYTPGFVHAKACIVDDIVGTVGTVNLDYRSLFLHFENNSLFYKSSLLADLKADYQETLEQCKERTPDNMKLTFSRMMLNGILRIFAPLC